MYKHGQHYYPIPTTGTWKLKCIMPWPPLKESCNKEFHYSINKNVYHVYCLSGLWLKPPIEPWMSSIVTTEWGGCWLSFLIYLHICLYSSIIFGAKKFYLISQSAIKLPQSITVTNYHWQCTVNVWIFLPQTIDWHWFHKSSRCPS